MKAYEVAFLHHLRNSTVHKGRVFSALCDSFPKKIPQRVPLSVFSALWDFFQIVFTPKGPPSIFQMICDRMDKKSQSVPFGASIRWNFWVFRVLYKRILWHFEVLLLFLSPRYGADLGRSRLVYLSSFDLFVKKIEKKRKMRVLNSLLVAKYLKGGTLWAFWHFSLLKELEGGPFEGKKMKKKVAQCRKKLKEGTLQSRPFSQMLEKVSGWSKDSNP